MAKLSLSERSNLQKELKSEEHFEKDLELFKKTFPNSFLNKEIARVNVFTKDKIHGQILNQLLDKHAKEVINEHRGVNIFVSAAQILEAKTVVIKAKLEAAGITTIEQEDIDTLITVTDEECDILISEMVALLEAEAANTEAAQTDAASTEATDENSNDDLKEKIEELENENEDLTTTIEEHEATIEEQEVIINEQKKSSVRIPKNSSKGSTKKGSAAKNSRK